ncbi:MAG: hypothetical protein JSR32_01980 [Proteobacteria bacterium]|nr:hypothetical protein [Pseudomonadota bacterium]
MFTPKRLSVLLATGVLSACVSMPTGPSVLTLPGSGKSFDQFRADDYECRAYAYQQVGGTTPQQSAQTSGVTSAAVGTGLGAAAGAAIGGAQGAAIGAGTGLLVGGATGAGAAATSAYALQDRYDIGYIQCMYAKGHRVPVSGSISSDQPVSTGSGPRVAPRPANFTPPPPPSGNPPAPPPQ